MLSTIHRPTNPSLVEEEICPSTHIGPDGTLEGASRDSLSGFKNQTSSFTSSPVDISMNE